LKESDRVANQRSYRKYSSLRTDIGTMTGGTLWVMCGLVLLAAVVGKFGGCTLAARFNGLPWYLRSEFAARINLAPIREGG
jgi:Kef-type K+ transport system membrane component KefB